MPFVPRLNLVAGAVAALLVVAPAFAQDSVADHAEPIVASIDPSKLKYDLLVDGNLAQDEPELRRFRTLPAAYAAAAEGTAERPTVIALRPNVYFLPGGAPRTPSLRIRKNYITFLGLTNNRRAVVLADNRGLMQGAEDNGYILDVDAIGFTMKNLTVLNYCNADYTYPGDPSKNLHRRSDVITQAVALQAAGDKHVYENVALLSRLDTMFLRTTRSYFKNVYIEGTDDWIGGGRISVWEDCTLVFPTGSGVMTASNAVFVRCRFEATRGMRFYKAEFGNSVRPDTLIDCVLPVATRENRIAWIRGPAAPRPSYYSLTYRVKDAAGNPARICDSSLGEAAFTYGRELSDQEARAFNPWNLLRAAPGAAPDDWDPAGARATSEATGASDLPYRIALNGGAPTIRTGGKSATFSAVVHPTTARDQTIRWSTPSPLVALKVTPEGSVVVTGTNPTGEAAWVPIHATASNGIGATAYAYVEPKYIEPPSVLGPPRLTEPKDGVVALDYAFAPMPARDQSIVTWYACDDRDGANARPVAVSRGGRPLQHLTLTPGLIGKFIQARIQPKFSISEAGPEVRATATHRVESHQVPTSDVAPDFENFVTDANETYANGWWTVLGQWTAVADEVDGQGWGVKPTGPSALLYQDDADRGDMQFELTMTPEKTEGMGFSIPGSPSDTGERNLHSDIYLKYDARTQTGYSLRFWRTTRSAAKCLFQLYRIEHGAGSPLNDTQVLSGVFKPTTKLTIKVTGTRLTVSAHNNVDGETLQLEGTITPNRFGGAGVAWPRGSSNVYRHLAIRYQ